MRVEAGLWFGRVVTSWLCLFLLTEAAQAQRVTRAVAKNSLSANHGDVQMPTNAPGWRRRARPGVVVVDSRNDFSQMPDGALRPRQVRTLGLRPMRQGLVEQGAWPKEPEALASVDPARFAQALAVFCPPWIGKTLSDQLASSVLRHSARFDIDPMLLAALMYQQSRCQPGLHNSYGVGLTMINPHMHERSIRDRTYRYGILWGESWQPTELELSRYEFSDRTLSEADANLYFAAAFLSIFKGQCKDIDEPFDSSAHRHYVSHFVWGDRVRGPGPEDRILLARRRLLQYYRKTAPPKMGTLGGLELSVPLDGAPRVVTSQFGSEREQGARLHRGVDFLSELGEPVRAVAPGVIIQAGAQFRRRGVVNIDPKSTRSIPAGRFGPQGLLVRIQHAGEVQTLYAHLVSYNVRVGQRVKRGELLGYVGRSGMKESDAHLHFGLFQSGVAIDPETILESNVFPFAETWGARPKRPQLEERDRSRRRRRHSVPRAGRVRSANHMR